MWVAKPTQLIFTIMADVMFCKVKISFVVIFAYFWNIALSENFLCPSACTCLGNMVDCSKRNLDSIPMDLPIWVKILDLSSNKISEVLPSAFQGLTNLDELNLSGNKVKRIDTELFIYLPQLKTLKLTYNELDELPSFPQNYNLTHLLLSHNKLRSLSTSLLRRTLSLRQLDLGFNKINELVNGTFPFLPNLHQLYLNNNRIGRLEKGTLDNLPNLEILKLGKNQIERLAAEVFKRLNQLKQLDLYRNKLQVIAGLTFSGLEKLSTLKLKRNNITQLSDGAFWGLSNINTLELDNNSLTQLKKAGLYGLESLKSMSLTHNRITYIEPGCWEFCPHLTTLQLSHNALEHINTDTFSKLTSLHSLWLNNNRVSYIAYKAFSDLYSLETLELNSNQISWTIEDMHGPFDGLVSLRRLSLEWNHIKSLTAQSFEGLEQLRQLELGHNEISSLQNNAFLNLKELQNLSLNTSALLCDCKMEWFAHWLRETGFQGSVSVKCAHPQLLRGVSLMEVQQFKCEDEDFLMPVIRKGPEAQIALKGNNVSLECLAASSSKSTMEIHWRKDNVPINNAKINTTATLVGDIVSMRSTLLITSAQFDHAGAYQCVASNDIGPTYSNKAPISVHIFPVFTKTPKDVTKKAGLKIELECAATGEPPPEISWQKDGGDDFPAARERRMHVQPDQDVFFISSVKIEDMGVYSCTASNAAGTVVTNATVTVLEVPKFAEPMRDLEVESGETAVLECMAQGSPTPRLEWLKNDHPLKPTERHFFTAEDQLLVVVEAVPEDSGKYTCVMTNTLGSERGSLHLDVIKYGGNSGGGVGSIFSDNSTTTGIIIIAVVCCVVGTSLIWVVIIYQTRRKNEEYSSTPTEETNIPDGVGYSSVEKDRNKLRTIYTSSGAKVYMNGGSTRLLGGIEHMNGGFHITSNPMEGDSWDPGRGEFEQDSREHLMSPSSSSSNSSNNNCRYAVVREDNGSDGMIRLPRRQSSASVTTDSNISSSSPGTQSTQSTIVLSTFHPHLTQGNNSIITQNAPGHSLTAARRRDEEEGQPVYTVQSGDSGYSSSTFPRPQTPQTPRHKTLSCSYIHNPEQSLQNSQSPAEDVVSSHDSSSGHLDTNHNSKHVNNSPHPSTNYNSNSSHIEPHIVVQKTGPHTESHSKPLLTGAPEGVSSNTDSCANRPLQNGVPGGLLQGTASPTKQEHCGAPTGGCNNVPTTCDSIADKASQSVDSFGESLISSGGSDSHSHPKTGCLTNHPCVSAGIKSNNNNTDINNISNVITTSSQLPPPQVNNNCHTQALTERSAKNGHRPSSCHDNTSSNPVVV